MTDDPTRLIHAYFDGELSADQERELGDWLRRSPENVDRFAAEGAIHSGLMELHSLPVMVAEPARSPSPALIGLPWVGGSPWIAYAVAVLLIGVGLLTALIWRSTPVDESRTSGQVGSRSVLPAPRQNVALAEVKGEQRPSKLTEKILVGWVASVTDCQWADGCAAAQQSEPVYLGRTFTLRSGLLEINYRTRAGVVLHGPATYLVDSPNGGFLGSGKLSVRVEQNATGDIDRRRDVSLPVVSVPPLTIRTPTAQVAGLPGETDEFGVEVDRSGVMQTHAFGGKIELRVTGPQSRKLNIVPMEKDQLVRVEDVGGKRVVRVTAGAALPAAFARRMPRDLRALSENDTVVRAFQAVPQGRPVADGGTDSDLRFIPVAAWGSDAVGDETMGGRVSPQASAAPTAATYTLRVKFAITDVPPETAVMRGRFVAYNYVAAIRLNDTALPGPKVIDSNVLRDTGGFLIRQGFRQGANTLEIDVNNFDPSGLAEHGFVQLHAELTGICVPTPENVGAVRHGGGQEKIIEVE